MRSASLTLAEPPVTVRLRVSRRARRFTLRLVPGEAEAILSLPPGVPLGEARAFLETHAGWLARALADHPGPVPVVAGARLPVEGRIVEVVAEAARRGTPHLDTGRLVVPGSGPVGPRIAAWLRERARAALAEATERHASVLGCRVGAITLRDTRSRWGSCSSRGRLGFSWRLAMAPPAVLDYVAAHEVAHLREMNHGRRFWTLVEALVPDYARHRGWLRREGSSLHRYRFTAD